MIYIATNTKGGVGKSTFIAQIASAYILRNQKSVRLIEIDDENRDCITFAKSESLKTEILPTSKIASLDELFIEEEGEEILLDIGGNKTSTIFLQEMKKLDEFEQVIWFIPLRSGEQDNQNALETYYKILEMDKDPKIIFVLSDVRSDDLEFEFLYFFGNEFLNTPMAIMKQIPDAQYISVKSSTIINISRSFNKSIRDISKGEIDFKLEAKKSKDKTLRRKYLFLNRVKNEAIEYMSQLEKSLFLELDRLLKSN
jgi:GTPase SAR1 family protein